MLLRWDCFCNCFSCTIALLLQCWFGICTVSNRSWHRCLCADLWVFLWFPMLVAVRYLFHLPASESVTHQSLFSSSQICPLKTVFTTVLLFRWTPWITKWQFPPFPTMLPLQDTLEFLLLGSFPPDKCYHLIRMGQNQFMGGGGHGKQSNYWYPLSL